MAIEYINVGSQANDGTGDPLRVAFEKVNNNFLQYSQTGFFTTSAYSLDNSPNQVIFQTDVNLFTEGTFQINTVNSATNDSQNITLVAAVSNDLTTVQFSGINVLFINEYLTNYDMDVFNGNVRILVSPFVNTALYHFISAQVLWANNPPGLNLLSEDGTSLVTESGNVPITTTQL
jgi:hypothetical protein